MNSQIRIFYDNWCPKCTRFSSFVRKMDVFDFIIILKLRDVDSHEYANIDFARAEKEMASVGKNHRACYGFDTLYKINLALPLLWIFLPVTYLLKVSGLGKIWYREIAINRQLALHCSESCKIHEFSKLHEQSLERKHD